MDKFSELNIEFQLCLSRSAKIQNVQHLANSESPQLIDVSSTFGFFWMLSAFLTFVFRCLDSFANLDFFFYFWSCSIRERLKS